MEGIIGTPVLVQTITMEHIVSMVSDYGVEIDLVHFGASCATFQYKRFFHRM